jgi:hypothetical protein
LEVPLRPAHGRTAEQVRVLLVEDHVAVREAIAGMFERIMFERIAGMF